MFNKKFIIVLIMLFIAVGAISAVSAADLNATDNVVVNEKLQTIEKNTVLQENAVDESFVFQNSTYVGVNDEDSLYHEVRNTAVSDNKLSLSASKLTTTYGTNKYFKVKVIDSQKNPVQGIKLNIKVYTGSKYKVYTATSNKDGIASLMTKSIAKGTHKVVVTISDKTYAAKSITSSIKVNQKALKITTKSSKVNTADFAGGMIDIHVMDKSSNKGLNGISLTLKIYTGKKYKTVKLVTGYDSDVKKNGVAGIFTNKYSVGTHKVIIAPTSSNYKGSATAKLVITKNSKKNYYNFYIYFTKGKLVYKIFK